MRVEGWVCPSSLSVVRIGKSSLAFRKVAPISASVSEYMTVLMIWNRAWMAPFLMDRVGCLLPFLASLSAKEKWPLARPRAHF